MQKVIATASVAITAGKPNLCKPEKRPDFCKPKFNDLIQNFWHNQQISKARIKFSINVK